jgi:hypothetical protein
MPRRGFKQNKSDQGVLCYLQWHFGNDDPAHGRLSLSIMPVEKAQSAALRAALRRENHAFTTLFHGSEQECVRERARIDTLTAALHEQRIAESKAVKSGG